MNPTRRSVTAVLALAAAALLGACGGGSSPSAAKARPNSIEDALGFDEGSMQTREAKVQEEVRRCMQAEGFDYVPIDPSKQELVRVGPGFTNDDKEFRRTKGYGVSTLAGESPTNSSGNDSDPNQRVREALSEEDRKAYDRALFGVGAESGPGPGGGVIIRDDAPAGGHSGSEPGAKVDGGCFQAANEKVGGNDFEKVGPKLEELEERVRSDPRMVKVDAAWSTCMAGAGYDFERPDDIVPALFERMNSLIGGPSAGSGVFTPPDPDNPELVELQRDELAMAKADDGCATKTGRTAVAKKVRAEAERRFLDENPDFGSDRAGA